MLALFVSAAVVAVERFINKRRLKMHEVLRDVGWLTLLFAFIEFSYLFIVESGTLVYGAAMRPLWHTEWHVFRSLLLESGVGVFLILTSVWLEQAGVAALLRMPPKRPPPRLRPAPAEPKDAPPASKCDVEW
jgi:hypothetical protein